MATAVTAVKESLTPIFRLLREAKKKSDRFFGGLNPVSVIEKRHAVTYGKPSAPDAEFSIDHDALKLFSVAVNMLAVRHGCVGKFFSEGTIYDRDDDTLEDGYFNHYGIRVLPGADQTAQDFYGNLYAMQIALNAPDTHSAMKAAIDDRLSDDTFNSFLNELNAGLARSIHGYVSYHDRLTSP